MICFLRRAETDCGKNLAFLQHVFMAEEPGMICMFDALPEDSRSRALKLFWAGAQRLINEDTEFVGICPDDFFAEPMDPAF